MTVYTYDFISLITHTPFPPPSFLLFFVGFFLHMELIKIVRLVNARFAELESSFQVLVW